MISRSLHTFFLIIVFCSSLFSQKIFEGKVLSDITWEKSGAGMKPYLPTSAVVYYKKDKTRTEMYSPSSTTIFIEDYTAGKRLILTTMSMGGIKQKNATISNLVHDDSEKFTIEKTEEYKTINNYNCQKIVTTFSANKTENKMISFVSNDFTISAALLSSGPVYTGLPMEQILSMESTLSRTVVKSISEEPVNDALFSLEVPSGYKVTDLSAVQKSTNVQNTTPTPVKKAEPIANDKKYATTSDADLKKLLDDALAKEDFDTAQAIKNEMDNRKK